MLYLDFFQIPKYLLAGKLPSTGDPIKDEHLNRLALDKPLESNWENTPEGWYLSGALLGKPFELVGKGLKLLGRVGVNKVSKIAPKTINKLQTAGNKFSLNIKNTTEDLSKEIENTYWARARAKGITPEEADIIVFNGNNPEEAELVLDRIAKVASNAKPGTEEYLKDIAQIRTELSRATEFNAGRAWNDYKIVHFDPAHEYSMLVPGLVKMHEVEHAVHIPQESMPLGTLNDIGLKVYGTLYGDGNYFFINNNTEIGARISLIWNKLGIKDNTKFTGEQLKQQFENYLKDLNVFDNEIRVLYKNIKDWNKLAEWANNPRNVYGTIGSVVGINAYKNNSVNDKQNYLYYFLK